MENERIMPPDYKAEILALVQSNLTPKHLGEKLKEYHESDLAAALDLMQREERNKLYSFLDTDTLAEMLEFSPEYLGELGIRKRVELLAVLEPSVAVLYLEGLEKGERATVMELLPSEARREITLLASFDKDEIGSKMTTNYIAVEQNADIRKTMAELVRQAAENDNVSTLFVLDEKGLFVGAIDLPDLIVARADQPLESITVNSFPYVYADEPIEDCLERLRGYAESSIPVLDRENRLQGVLTAHDLADLIGDELEDDYAKLAGLAAEEDLKEPLHRSIGKRLPWLVILFGLGLLVSGVAGLFERITAELTVIVAFQSLILGMAGNVGTQSLAVTIRMLMDEALTTGQKWQLIGKEARVGLCNGFIVGAISVLAVGVYLQFLRGVPNGFGVALCIGIALLVAMLLSSVSGTAIPIFLKKCRIDPAVASGPFITTLNDLVAITVYYSIAGLLL